MDQIVNIESRQAYRQIYLYTTVVTTHDML